MTEPKEFILQDDPKTNVPKPYTSHQQTAYDHYRWAHANICNMFEHLDRKQYDIVLLVSDALQAHFIEAGLLDEKQVADGLMQKLSDENPGPLPEFHEAVFAQCELACRLALKAHEWADIRDKCGPFQKRKREEANAEFEYLVKGERTLHFLLVVKLQALSQLMTAAITLEQWRD